MNTINDQNDMALHTLLQVAREVSPQLPEELLKRIYLIQRAHQFEADRGASLQSMQRVLDAYLDQMAGGGETK